ncbi:N-(5'-phosphoribosyl)anthranilate isomerase [Paenibacillus darwinianus]|uniref:N-(5'-phosphoribosyl)anthranilate isomerase n=1 Tax=Paenibacillus darwinianus TaxID=1380763 RepID=A0A9W5S3P0_9BACL|nr:phosphoribosylanthranilate isomerase [Paenibacillus darwinianus]EXX91286.1 N-(5'-phosphoribosyl)anthranilate isomerase [Paenibacillus darwinianus]EXX92102.1 N-(5'-phosphoribosyl)anthranilate isomerase [Paenibacillus darwinianus]EXX92539.1 N-(5'-phosphoribosyl)anthranilate isomerase [Paenibacillus darwinianus]
MSARIKICGLRDAETIREMDGLPIDEIGFIFAKSRRQVTPEQAAGLIAEACRLRGSNGLPPRTVGVFVNPELEELQALLGTAPLDVLQLHGGESAADCRAIREATGKMVWKVFSIRGDERVTAADRVAPYAGAVDGIMIDTAGGGTGTAFDWSVIGDYKEAAEAIGVPLYVAGGLHADNVAGLAQRYAPDGVDVSSGVETDGVKDITKIRTFVERVRAR